MKSDFITENLAKIEQSLQSQIFIDVEKSKIELKDLSTGNDWNSLKETICAFLNTEGGVVFCGIRERNKQYLLKGFDRNNESNIIALHTKCFTDDNHITIDLSENIHFDYYQLGEKEIVVIAVYPLSDDLKYVSYNGKYYERKLTQDHEIPAAKLQRQKEYKLELEYAKELTFVDGAQISDLSLDKINKYINLLNLEIRNETLKPTLVKAKEFLGKQHFIKDTNITTLGMLVCGNEPFHFIGERVEVDCYYDTSSDIGKDKKIFRNDIINLMEDTFRYIWGHIKVNRTIREGGKSVPEYPEKMIRETINNALAHRDYTINGFITVTVEPNNYIEIKNPGSFKEKMKLVHTESEIQIRRLIPGIPESKNPKLASVLKVFDKIESQGRGMASLVNAALENLVDLPYYEIRQDVVCLKIPTGKLVNDEIEDWLNGFNAYIVGKLRKQLSEEHKSVLAYFYKSELLNMQRFFTILLTESNNHFAVIEDLKRAELIQEHPATTEESAVYVLDRVLMKTQFVDKIMELIGEDYIYYDSVAQQILDVVYLYSKYNSQAMRASDITPLVYRRLHGKDINPKRYESMGRKVRSLCNILETKNILLKGEKSAYSFNF
ncbi:MAG: putative DNA binding domain-containing protein [Bacteroidales bacterium]|nr:putative DNA binding domain-containing protein [Bacteroidales bacterium]